jgi:hypothetical protein
VLQVFSISLKRGFADVRLLPKVNRNVAKSTSLGAQPVRKAACSLVPRRRIAAVVNDDTRVSTDSPTGNKSGRPNIKPLTSGTQVRASNRASPNRERATVCETQGAMSQQSNEAAHGHESVPQKLLQLVGYRDPNACAASWHRPRRNGTG